MGKLKICKRSVLGTLVEVSWTTDLGSERRVSISVSEDGLNLVATGSLNASGIAALEQALAVAKVISANQLQID